MRAGRRPPRLHMDLQAPVAEGRARRARQTLARFRAADTDGAAVLQRPAAEKRAAGGGRGGGTRGAANGLAD